MAAILQPGDIKDVFPTDIPDAAIRRLIDAAEESIDSRYGARASSDQTDAGDGGMEIFPLSRPAATITSVTERLATTDTVLAADDYESLHGGRILRRLSDGTNGAIIRLGAAIWGDRVTVVYKPVSDDNQRKRVVIDLVKLSIRYDATTSTRDGDHSESRPGYEKERESILGSLSPAFGSLV